MLSQYISPGEMPQDSDNIQLLVWLKIISVKVGTKDIRNATSSLINLTVLQRILECYEPAFNVRFSIKAENCTGEKNTQLVSAPLQQFHR